MAPMRPLAVALCVWFVASVSPVDAQVPPDIVRLTDGGMLRGTILEHVPGSHVEILMLDGERRRVEAARVSWAGPAIEMPIPAPAVGPPVAPSGVLPGVDVRFEADRENVRVYALGGFDRDLVITGVQGSISSRYVNRPIWDALCQPPCALQMVPRRYFIGVGLGERRRIHRVDPQLDASTSTSVRIHWEDRGLFRVIGALVWSIGGAAGTVGVAVGTVDCASEECADASLALAVSSAIGVGISSVVGLVLALLNDVIRLDQSPR